MATDPPPLPAGFIAAIDMPAVANGGRRLGVEVSCQGQPEPIEAGGSRVPIIVELFTSPPTLAIGGEGEMHFDPATGRVAITTTEGHVRIEGQLAEDRQGISGEVTIRDLHFQEIEIEHLTSPIELAGFEES